MADLFVEILSEEIPAWMQAAAEKQLADAMPKALHSARLGGELHKSWSGPRRLAVAIGKVNPHQEAWVEERRGPRVDAPAKAIDGFRASLGASSVKIDERDTPKGRFLFATINHEERSTSQILPQIINGIIDDFSWPKSQRWGRGKTLWIRPVRRITVIFDGQGVDGRYDLSGGEGIDYGCHSVGHRFLAPSPIDLSGEGDIVERYEVLLKDRYVLVSRDDRRAAIEKGFKRLEGDAKVKIIRDEVLLKEVIGLVEWPNPLMGTIDNSFRKMPWTISAEVMWNHQKYFATGEFGRSLDPHFIVVSNMENDQERNKTIISGNERVLRARLNDARFFWERDKKIGIESFAEDLEKINFFEGLGTMEDKTERLKALSKALYERSTDLCDVNEKEKNDINEAARLAKADLMSNIVNEFPKLRGGIGFYLAHRKINGDNAGDSEGDKVIPEAIAMHYKPVGSEDGIPLGKIAQIVALADKIDTLVGFFGIGKRPTGSGDPYALRRAALGVIRILVEGKISLDLKEVCVEAHKLYPQKSIQNCRDDLVYFIHERLLAWLRDKHGISPDHVKAAIGVEALSGNIWHLKQVAEELSVLFNRPDGARLIEVYRRINNILEAANHNGGAVDKNLLIDPAEINLHQALEKLPLIKDANFEKIKERIAGLDHLCEPIDDFFKQVLVNDPKPRVRTNRFALLAKIRTLMLEVADFSMIESVGTQGGAPKE